MRFKKCVNGHFYDEEKSSLCPYCKENSAINSIPLRFKNLGEVTFLGSGSISQVFKISGEQEYALKIVQCGTDELKYQNALYEIRIMERLKGEPLVVQLCDYEIIDTSETKTIYMLEEYHNTMTNYLSSKSFCVTDIVQLIIGVCDSLLACKKLDVLHLDVQSKNIFIDNPFSVKLGDFSHSLFERDAHSNHIARGTLAFMAPEVYQKGNCSEQSDIYSVGLILYSLFNKKVLPFMDAEAEDVSIYKRLAGTPFPEISLENREVQNDLNRIINKACSYDQINRYTSLSALRTELYELYERINADPEKNVQIYAKLGFISSSVIGKSFDADSIARSVIMFDADSIARTASEKPGVPISPVVPGGELAGVYTSPCISCGDRDVNAVNLGPYSGCVVASEPPDVDIKKVEFSAIAPKQLIKGDYTIINLIMYDKASRHIVDSIIKEMGEPAQESRSGIHHVKEGSSVKVILSSPDITIDDNVETGVWQGGHLDFSFAVFLPEQYKKRQILFIASVYINDVITTKLKFIVKCASLFKQKIAVTREDIFSAFVSYASQDRNRVAAIIQGMKKARPDLDVFFDVDSLRSGDDWEQALRQEIERCDILFLCWSHFARESKWVDTEWRYALEQKGADCIEPVPIEPPDICPPPEELNHKHFNDKLLYIINATEGSHQ